MTTRSTFTLAGIGAFLLLLLASCNAILDNSEGYLVAKDAGATEARCAQGQKACGGACVDILNPAFGCKPDDCTACQLDKTLEYKCAGIKDGLECGVTSCFDRYSNCDGANPTGCEVDLRKVENCGSCNALCEKTDYCDSYSANIHCVLVCPEGSTRCEDTHQCIDPQTDIANCGGCGVVCDTGPGTIPTCEAGSCSFRCDSTRGFRKCGDKCVQEGVDSCGASCTKCPAPGPNHTMACESGKCTEKCSFPLCDGQCIPPAECKSPCVGNVVDCGSGKCDTDICSVTSCGGCNMPCSTTQPNTTVSCAPPDVGNPNCHCVTKCAANAIQCPIGGCVVPNANPNCGMCGRDCSTLHQECMVNNCGICEAGWLDCNPGIQGCETSATYTGSTMHCGQCNRACSMCVNGICQGTDGGFDGGLDGGPQDGAVQMDGAPPIDGAAAPPPP